MLSEEALEARREYRRKWRQNNPDKVREQQIRYWTRKAEQQAREKQEAQNNNEVQDEHQEE